jgi:hypothetical protein
MILTSYMKINFVFRQLLGRGKKTCLQTWQKKRSTRINLKNKLCEKHIFFTEIVLLIDAKVPNWQTLGTKHLEILHLIHIW